MARIDPILIECDWTDCRRSAVARVLDSRDRHCGQYCSTHAKQAQQNIEYAEAVGAGKDISAMPRYTGIPCPSPMARPATTRDETLAEMLYAAGGRKQTPVDDAVILRKAFAEVMKRDPFKLVDWQTGT